jgi:hypothetical protein
LLLIALAAHQAGGQAARARVAGRVIDRATTAPVVGANIVLLPKGEAVTTDSAGRYRFAPQDTGTYRIVVRALPYAPTEANVVVRPATDVEKNFALDSATARAQTLGPVSVNADRPDYRLADFERRRKTGRGFYLDDGQIRRSTASNLQDLTHGMRGVDLRCGGGPGGCRIYMLRAPMGCEPEYVIDNQVDNTFGPGTPIRDIVALEVYTGPADVPGEFAGRNAGCGVIVIWTRSGPPKPLKP